MKKRIVKEKAVVDDTGSPRMLTPDGTTAGVPVYYTKTTDTKRRGGKKR